MAQLRQHLPDPLVGRAGTADWPVGAKSAKRASRPRRQDLHELEPVIEVDVTAQPEDSNDDDEHYGHPLHESQSFRIKEDQAVLNWLGGEGCGAADRLF